MDSKNVIALQPQFLGQHVPFGSSMAAAATAAPASTLFPTAQPQKKSIDPKITGEHMTGTSIMALSFDGGVVLGADSRTSTGDYVANRASDKLTKVHDYIYCARSGSAADTQALADIVSYYLNLHAAELGETPLVHTAATLFADLVYKNKDRLMAAIIVAGWDKKFGGQVYMIDIGGAMIKQPLSVSGSGSTYIWGWCDSEYKKGFNKQQCEEFVKRGLSHAMARDGSSGGLIRMVTITEQGVAPLMVPGDKLAFQAEQIQF